MCKLVFVFLTVCIIQHVSSYALGDPLVASIQNTRSAISIGNQQISLKIQAIGNQIGNVKATSSITLNNIKNEAEQSSTPCAVDTKQAVQIVFNKYNSLEQCRKGNEFGIIKNTFSSKMNAQIALANQSKSICSSEVDYTACATDAADKINADVSAIIVEMQQDASALNDIANNCVTSNSVMIDSDVRAVSAQWSNCNAEL